MVIFSILKGKKLFNINKDIKNCVCTSARAYLRLKCTSAVGKSRLYHSVYWYWFSAVKLRCSTSLFVDFKQFPLRYLVSQDVHIMSDIYGRHFTILRSINFFLMVAVLAHIDLKVPNNILKVF